MSVLLKVPLKHNSDPPDVLIVSFQLRESARSHAGDVVCRRAEDMASSWFLFNTIQAETQKSVD